MNATEAANTLIELVEAGKDVGKGEGRAQLMTIWRTADPGLTVSAIADRVTALAPHTPMLGETLLMIIAPLWHEWDVAERRGGSPL